MVLGHPHIPNRDLTIFTSACEHVLVDIVESCAIKGLLRDLALDGARLPTLPKIPSTNKQNFRTFNTEAKRRDYLHFVETIIAAGYELMIIVR